jgi:hypothetical protein
LNPADANIQLHEQHVDFDSLWSLTDTQRQVTSTTSRRRCSPPLPSLLNIEMLLENVFNVMHCMQKVVEEKTSQDRGWLGGQRNLDLRRWQKGRDNVRDVDDARRKGQGHERIEMPASEGDAVEL